MTRLLVLCSAATTGEARLGGSWTTAAIRHDGRRHSRDKASRLVLGAFDTGRGLRALKVFVNLIAALGAAVGSDLKTAESMATSLANSLFVLVAKVSLFVGAQHPKATVIRLAELNGASDSIRGVFCLVVT